MKIICVCRWTWSSEARNSRAYPAEDVTGRRVCVYTAADCWEHAGRPTSGMYFAILAKVPGRVVNPASAYDCERFAGSWSTQACYQQA